MYTLATLVRLRQQMGLSASDTGDDARLQRALESASAEIERLTGRRFTPRRATLAHSIDLIDATEILLDEDLLELTALTNGDGGAISLSEVLLLPGDADSPSDTLRLTGGNAFVYDETPEQAVQVTGLWGWHNRWSQAWRDSGDTVGNNPLTAAASSITVSDADGADAEGESPRFQAGQLARIADEYLWVLAVNSGTNTLTVARGANGTTAASHAQGTAIDGFQPAAGAVELAIRWATWLYRQPDSVGKGRDLTTALLESLYGLRRVSVRG